MKINQSYLPDRRSPVGFCFMGYWFSPTGLSIAQKTVERMAEKALWLYEQGADNGRIGAYLRHWVRWVRTGVDGVFGGLGIVGCSLVGYVSAVPYAP